MPSGSQGMRRLADVIARNDTGFGGRVADNTTNRLDISSTYPPNTERHKLVVNGTEDRTFSTNFTNLPAKWQLTAADGDTVQFSTRELFRYVASYEALFGMAAWYDTAAENLTSGQRLFIELSDDARDNGYFYEFTPDNTRCFIRSGGVEVDTLPQSEWGETTTVDTWAQDPFDGHIQRDQPMNPRGFVNWYGVGEFRATISYTKSDGRQYNATLGHLANADDIATEEINLKPRVVASADAGASSFTVNLSSMGTLIRGNATEFDRPRAAVFYGLGGSIGPEYANNVPLLAKRRRDGYENVSIKVEVPEFSPAGDTTVDLIVIAVDADDTDASGFAPSQQGDPQNTAVEYTTNVSTFPTETRAVPTGGTAEVPDGRLLASSVAEGGKNTPAKAEAGPSEQNKRVLGQDEVALYIPRTAGSTGVSLNWLRPRNKQDW